MHITTAPIPIQWATIATVAVAVIGAVATVLAALVAHRSSRTAARMALQAQSQTSSLESVDRRIDRAFDANEADNTRLHDEIGRYQEREGVLLNRLSSLEAAFTAHRDQADARIRDLSERVTALYAEVSQLRSLDTQWKRWASAVLMAYATLAERLHRANGEDAPPLPPTPPQD
jgi:chromosome segregation ATPase